MPDLLLIDDNPDLRKVIQEAVEIDGYDVRVARDAEEALLLLDGGYQPSVIICDVALPHMNGLEFVRQIRQNALWQQIMFIAMSGVITMKQDALTAGANHFLVKPFSFSELFEILDKSKC